MKEIYNDLKNFIKKNFIGLIVIISLGIISAIITICWYNIPRLSYTYMKEYDGYVVDHAFGNSKKYTIPASYKDSKVVGIGTRAFYKHDRLLEIEFENQDNIEIIMKLSFYQCSNLEYIDLLGVDTIERNAFSYCTSLNNIELDAYQIGASAFYKCEALDTISLNEGIKSIGSMAFSNTKISDIILPRSVTHVYSDAFIDMEELKSITIQNEMLMNNDYIKSLGSLIKYEG